MNIFVSQHKSDSWHDFLTEENLELRQQMLDLVGLDYNF